MSLKRLLPSILSAMAVSMALWLADLLSLSSHSFAGVTDRDAADRVLSVTGNAIFTFELQLAVVHALLGGLLGLLIGVSWRSLRPSHGPLRQAAGTSAMALVVFSAALFGMVASYPQLYADRWWLSGGALAALQYVLTQVLGPTLFDVFLVSFIAAIAALSIRACLRPFLSADRGGLPRYVLAGTGVLLVVGAVRVGLSASSPETDAAGPVNLLILAADSLRSDRLEDEAIMPNLASMLAEGSLYRHAITPIARTYPSWVSTLTGSEPRIHGVRHMFPTTEVRSDVGATLFTELRDQGYFTFVTSDFAGDIFPGFEAGFEVQRTPHLNVDTLAASSALGGHTWSLPLLRLSLFRALFPFWKNLPSIAEPRWLVEDLKRLVNRSEQRPFAGLVFFSTAHFPYVAPHPFYQRRAGDYRGPYLYHVPPVLPQEQPSPEDVVQIRARYDGALGAIDSALAQIFDFLRESGRLSNTLVVVTGDHGEELYELEGIAGHGDTVRYSRSQSVPVFLKGPGVPTDRRSDAQVRLYDLPATALHLLDSDGERRTFGQGVSLLDEETLRPICVETGIWFWPGRPPGLDERRLDYPGISQLLELDTATREMVLRPDMEALIESAKERGLVVGNRLWREQLTPHGPAAETDLLMGPTPAHEEVDLRSLFEQRCVEGDPLLSRLYGSVVFERQASPRAEAIQ